MSIKGIRKTVKKSITDEKQASPHYRKLASRMSKAGLKKEAKTVRGIAKVETQHRKKLKKILRKLK
jgi:rubrerythrin